MSLHWKGHGQVSHGGYYQLSWHWSEKRNSIVYTVRSFLTGRVLLRREIF